MDAANSGEYLVGLPIFFLGLVDSDMFQSSVLCSLQCNVILVIVQCRATVVIGNLIAYPYFLYMT